MQFKALALLAVSLIASVAEAGPVGPKIGPKVIMRLRSGYPNAKDTNSTYARTALSCESVPTTGDIIKHSGPIMKGQINLYYIWYGKWTKKQKDILENLGKHIGSSPYYNVEKSYGTTGAVVFKKSINDNYSQGKSLSDATLPLILKTAIKRGLPADSNGIYFINTDATVQETSGFCTRYCGFHTNAVINGKRLKYAFIGNPVNCLNGCSPCNTVHSPNGDLGVDAMASVFSHELVETASDPLGSAWFDGQGYENADKCAYTYGSTTFSGGAYSNMKINGLNYLIQQNWKATGGCFKK